MVSVSQNSSVSPTHPDITNVSVFCLGSPIPAVSDLLVCRDCVLPILPSPKEIAIPATDDPTEPTYQQLKTFQEGPAGAAWPDVWLDEKPASVKPVKQSGSLPNDPLKRTETLGAPLSSARAPRAGRCHRGASRLLASAAAVALVWRDSGDESDTSDCDARPATDQ